MLGLSTIPLLYTTYSFAPLRYLFAADSESGYGKYSGTIVKMHGPSKVYSASPAFHWSMYYLMTLISGTQVIQNRKSLTTMGFSIKLNNGILVDIDNRGLTVTPILVNDELCVPTDCHVIVIGYLSGNVLRKVAFRRFFMYAFTDSERGLKHRMMRCFAVWIAGSLVPVLIAVKMIHSK